MQMGTLIAETSKQVTEIVIWCGLLMLAVIVLFGGLWYYRRRLFVTDEPAKREPWTLEDLRQMKERGEVSDEEYQALRETMIAAFRGEQASQKAQSTPLPAGEPHCSVGGTDKNGSDFDLRNGPSGCR